MLKEGFMKHLNSDKVYKYIPKDQKENEKARQPANNTIAKPNNTETSREELNSKNRTFSNVKNNPDLNKNHPDDKNNNYKNDKNPDFSANNDRKYNLNSSSNNNNHFDYNVEDKNQDYENHFYYKHNKHTIDEKRLNQKKRFTHYTPASNNKYFNNKSQKANIFCSRCNKELYDLLNSFYNEEKNEYYCFDCALAEVKEKLQPDPKNRIIYLGAGTFGEVKEIKSEKKFMILKRIRYLKPKFEKFAVNYLPNEDE